MTSIRLAFIALLSLAPVWAFAQNAPSAAVRATVESVAADGASLSVRTRGGDERTVRLTPKTRYVLVAPASLTDVKPGAFVGVAAAPGDAGQLKALEVHIFPESMRGTGEGSRPFDLGPGSTMTNGTVSARVDAVNGPALTVTYKGGEQTIVIDPKTPIVTVRARRRNRRQARGSDHCPRAEAAGRVGRSRVLPGRQGRAGSPHVSRPTARSPPNCCVQSICPRQAYRASTRTRSFGG